MQDETSAQDLKDRLALIEIMLAEGRQTTESWGSIFVLWGVAFYAAMAWAAWRPRPWVWPVTMVLAAAVTLVLASIKAGRQAKTALGRSIVSVWAALGVSMFVIFVPLGMTGRLGDARVFIAVASAMLGMASATSALILRWKVQFGCAVTWWAAAVAACFLRPKRAMLIFLAAIFICQIVFGIYGMIHEGGAKPRRDTAHV